MREVTIERNTNETQIELTLNLDGAGRYQVDTGCGFLNHMLELFARHGRFDLVLTCHGDVEVDYHHTTEDVGIALGQAFAQALGDMRGIHRYGSFYLPMDESLILCAVDISPLHPELGHPLQHRKSRRLRRGVRQGILAGLCPQRAGHRPLRSVRGREQPPHP